MATWYRLPLALLVTLAALPARADEPLVLRRGWAGNIDFFSTGAPLARDTNNDGKVDQLSQPGLVTISAIDLPVGIDLDTAYLYWGATRDASQCQDANLDKEVEFTPPGGAPAVAVAEVCYCSASPSYDMQLCRADVTAQLGALVGEYAVDGLDALVENNDTNNASYALVLVYRGALLPQRRIGLYDGLLGLVSGGTPTTTLQLTDLNVTNPPQGDLTWYALEGDVAPNQNEFVEVKALPGGGLAKLSDPINAVGNPFNRTINTTNPAQTGVTGVDIDRFPLAAILDPGDQTLEVKYSAGIDKYWIAFNVIGVDVFEPVFSAASTKEWTLTGDADGDGQPTPGDTVTYLISLENTGTAEGTVDLTDLLAPEFASFTVLDDGGGVDNSAGDTVAVSGLVVAPQASVAVEFEVVLADAPDLTAVVNVAHLEGDGGAVDIFAPELVLRRDGDADGHYDTADNCPEVANPDQADADADQVGDACDEPAGTTGDESTGGPETTGTSGDVTGDATGDESGPPVTTGVTSGATTGADSNTGGGSNSGETGDDRPTTGGDGPSGPGPGPGESSSEGGESGTDSAGGASDGGCGCRGAAPTASAWSLLLLGLARRRRR